MPLVLFPNLYLTLMITFDNTTIDTRPYRVSIRVEPFIVGRTRFAVLFDHVGGIWVVVLDIRTGREMKEVEVMNGP